ncbi:carbohydrate esterase family 1 protein [Xylariales sp. AK1849]|nr:carbohydrate esterase family 1 protein [Xylariales sp. AK1849]
MLWKLLSSLSLVGVDAATALDGRLQTPGCGLSPPFSPGVFQTDTISTADGDREFGVWIPSNYDEDKATRLILSYHGAGGTVETQKALDRLTDTTFNVDHIIVYLQGLPNEEDDSHHSSWQGVPGANADDLGFTSGLLDFIESQFCIDTGHIYATGKSQGAGFVGQLACNAMLSTRIAAFAPVSGAYYNKDLNNSSICFPQNMTIPCTPGRTGIPILAFHGGADSTVKYHGAFRKNACLPDVKHWIEEWARRDGLDTIPVNETIPVTVNRINMTFGRGLVKLVYDGDYIPHDWPASFSNSDNGGQNLVSFNATTWIMGFFNAHSLSQE